MKKEKKELLERKLHHNIIDMIDEFNTDHNANITEITYRAKNIKSNAEDSVSYDDIEFEIATDL